VNLELAKGLEFPIGVVSRAKLYKGSLLSGKKYKI
jgi:hypothetical protein